MAKRRERIQWKNQLVNFVAIVVGVYIAYLFTNIKEEADKKKQEQFYLQGLQVDLARDQRALQESFDTMRYYRDLHREFIGALWQPSLPDSVVSEYVSALYVQVPFIPQDNTYQTLLSGGMEAIDDFELRKQIVELYNQHYGYIRIVDEIVKNQKDDVLLPYMIDKARFSSAGLTNKELLQENAFVNLVYLSYYSNFKKIEVDSTALVMGRELLDAVEKRLKK